MSTGRCAAVWLVALATGCGSPPQQSSPAASDELVTFEQLKNDLDRAVEQELAELDLEVGQLRSEADASEEDFTSELVHLDGLMRALEVRMDEAVVEGTAEVQSLMAETERRLREINETYTHLKMRIEASTEETQR